MLVVDRVHFIMPKDGELQFPAMAALHTYVNGYKQRTKQNDPSAGKATFELEYSVDMSEEDWAFFKRAGLKFDKEPGQAVGVVDMVADLSDDRINNFIHQGKHVASVCAMMCGVQSVALLNLRKVKPANNGRWLTLHGSGFTGVILDLKDDEVVGVIGNAGVETYLAASMGLGVVEIQPEGRPRYWMPKWLNKYYRMVDKPDQALRQAMASVERSLNG